MEKIVKIVRYDCVSGYIDAPEGKYQVGEYIGATTESIRGQSTLGSVINVIYPCEDCGELDCVCDDCD